MSQVIVFLLLGIGSGGLIAGVGMGVVLSYRGAGVINLATGAVAMLAGYFFWAVRLGRFATIPAVPAVILTLVFAAIIGVLFDFLVVRPQLTATPLAKLIATLGARRIFQAFIVITFGRSAQPQPVILPSQSVPGSGSTTEAATSRRPRHGPGAQRLRLRPRDRLRPRTGPRVPAELRTNEKVLAAYLGGVALVSEPAGSAADGAEPAPAGQTGRAN